MDGSTSKALRAALYRLLRPLARVMLRHGMAYGSFAELARKAYVDEAAAQLRLSGKRASISSISAMTGLTRKEASRLFDADMESASDSDQRHNRAVRVLTAWTVDPRFQDEQGSPRPLPTDGDNSFATLVHDYSGDVTPVAMLATLKGSQSVMESDGIVTLLSRSYLPTQTPIASLQIFGNDVAELLTTIDHNLTHQAGSRVFQRKVSTDGVDAGVLEEFRNLCNTHSQQLLEHYDQWLAEREPDGDSAADGTAHYVSVGIYYFDSTLFEEPTP